MSLESLNKIWQLVGLRYKSHPWHGIDIGENAPKCINAFIEVIPTDTVKYEIDKKSGYLKIDRPQKFSNIVPALYGFIPKTLCTENVANYCMEKTNRKGIVGDNDPLDICVITERAVTHGNIIVSAIPIGGFRMIDGGEADDKIIAILKSDETFGIWKDITDVPEQIINRLKHYFLTYKQLPGEKQHVEITHTYDRAEALEVIRKSQKDYDDQYGNLEESMSITFLEAMNFGTKKQKLLDNL